MELRKELFVENFNWENIVDQTAETFRLNDEEKNRLKRSKVGKLIGALPYLANCEEAERTSLSHLGIYLIAAKGGKQTFNHNVNDNESILDRLETISHFKGGDQKVIEKGMKLLALNMVHGYFKDIEKDYMNGKYNPIGSGAWNYKGIVKQLTNDIENIVSANVDEYFTLDDALFYRWIYSS